MLQPHSNVSTLGYNLLALNPLGGQKIQCFYSSPPAVNNSTSVLQHMRTLLVAVQHFGPDHRPAVVLVRSDHPIIS